MAEWKSKSGLGGSLFEGLDNIATQAKNAQELVKLNLEAFKSGLELSKVLLLANLNPYVVLLNTLADEIETYVSTFRNIGFHSLVIFPTDANEFASLAGNIITIEKPKSEFVIQESLAKTLNLSARYSDWLKETTGFSSTDNMNDVVEFTVPSQLVYNPIFNLYEITPSQTISLIIQSLYDELDLEKPVYNENEAAGMIVIMSAADPDIFDPIQLSDFLTNLERFLGDAITQSLRLFKKLLADAASISSEGVTQEILVREVLRVTYLNEQYSEPMLGQYDTAQNNIIYGQSSKVGGTVLEVVSTVDNGATMVDQVLKVNVNSKRDAEKLFEGFENERIIQGKKTNIIDITLGEASGNPERIVKNTYAPLYSPSEFKFNQELNGSSPNKKPTRTEEKVTTLVGRKGASRVNNTPPPPNWNAHTLGEYLPQLTGFLDFILDFAEGLRESGKSISDNLDEIINQINAKIIEGEALFQQINDMLEMFQGLETPDLYILKIEPVTGGTPALIDELRKATNRPSDKNRIGFSMALTMNEESLKLLSPIFGV